MIGALEALVNLVNAQGTELGVTLLVQGRTVGGTLTPNGRFSKWAAELFQGAAEGKTRRPIERTPAVSEEEARAVREDWKDFERRVLEYYPTQKAGELLDHAYDQCCLRDVKVYGTMTAFGSAQITERYPYLMIKMASVDALAIGLYEATEPEKTNG